MRCATARSSCGAASSPSSCVLTNAATVSSGQGVATVNLLSAAGAQAAISIIDAAIQNVNVSAGQLGALQTRFTAVPGAPPA